MDEMPQICLGTVLQSTNLELMKTKFKEAIDHGYRHIDSAQLYNNMEIMPEVIQFGIEIYGRAHFWITWKYDSFINETKIIADINKLDCGYFDLVLIHFPSDNINSNKAKMDVLIKLKNDGIIKNIGVSNYENPAKLIELNEYLKTKGCCIYANQIQARPIRADANVIKGRPNSKYDLLLGVCKVHNIRLMLFSPYSALVNSMYNNIINEEYWKTITNIINNLDFGKKVISYYTRKYLVGTRNVLINGVSTGKSCIQNYNTIQSILNGTHTNTNQNKKNNTNVFNIIQKYKLTKM